MFADSLHETISPLADSVDNSRGILLGASRRTSPNILQNVEFSLLSLAGVGRIPAEAYH